MNSIRPSSRLVLSARLLLTYGCALSFAYGFAYGQQVNTSVESNVPYEIRGYLKLNGESFFSVRHMITGGSRWVGNRQPFGEIRVLGFDSQTGLFKALYQDREVYLEMLKTDESAPTSPILQFSDNPDSEKSEAPLDPARIKALVRDYEAELKEGLPDPSHHLYDAMHRSLGNRVSAYESGLKARAKQQNLPDGTSETVPNNIKPRIGSLRERNAVNSRIWASDHIEIHGAPAL